MKIVHVYAGYAPSAHGGIQRHLGLLREGLARAGHQVIVLAASSDARTRLEGDPAGRIVYAGTVGRVAGRRLCPSLPGWLRRLRPGILHFHSPSPFSEIAGLLASVRCSTVVTYHCEVERHGWRRLHDSLLQRLLRRADRIVVTSPQALESAPALAAHRGRCVVVPLGLDLARLGDSARAQAVARGVRDAAPGPVVLFVGRLRRYKGLDVLMEAMRGVPGTLVVVGRGPEEEALRRKAREPGLGGRVVFAGDVPDEDLPGYYRAANLLALPSVSRAEFFGQVLVEAMACGLPVVSTRLGTGTSLVNADGVTGTEVPPGDPEALAAAVRRLIENPDEARRMGERGRLRAAGFDAQVMIDRTAALYADLAGSPRPATAG